MLVWRGLYCPGLVVLIYLVRSDLVALFCFPKSCVFALVCIGLVEAALFQAGVSVPFWFGPLCFTLDWSAVVFLVSLFSYSLVWFKLVCAVCCARAGLVKQHDCGIERSCLSQYVGRCNSIWFGLTGFSFYEVWSDCSVLVSSI